MPHRVATLSTTTFCQVAPLSREMTAWCQTAPFHAPAQPVVDEAALGEHDGPVRAAPSRRRRSSSAWSSTASAATRSRRSRARSPTYRSPPCGPFHDTYTCLAVSTAGDLGLVGPGHVAVDVDRVGPGLAVVVGLDEDGREAAVPVGVQEGRVHVAGVRHDLDRRVVLRAGASTDAERQPGRPRSCRRPWRRSARRYGVGQWLGHVFGSP